MFFLFSIHISSRVRSRFICSPINLKFGGEVLNSLIFILKGGDWDWSSKSNVLCSGIVIPIKETFSFVL